MNETWQVWWQIAHSVSCSLFSAFSAASVTRWDVARPATNAAFKKETNEGISVYLRAKGVGEG